MMPEFIQSPDVGRYYSENFITIDLEIDTSHGDFGHPVHKDNGLLLASYKIGHEDKVHSIWGGEYGAKELLDAIEHVDFMVAHNAKYELGWLHRCGLDLRNVLVFDTQLAEYVLMGNLACGDEKMRPRRISLDNCAIRRGMQPKDPAVDLMMKHNINPIEIPRPWLQGRCEADVNTTYDVFISQRERLEKSGRLGLLYTRCLLTPLLAATEFEGMALDPEAVDKEYESHKREYAKLEKEMNELTGGINFNSPKQVGEFLYTTLGFDELTRFDRAEGGHVPLRGKSGNPRTDTATLDKLKATNAEQRKFLSLRKKLSKVNAALTKNLEFFSGVCKEKGGVFHAVFNQTNTATHRLSSSGLKTKFERFDKEKGVQFQNLPRTFKPLFKAKREGWKILEWDGSQLEFRVAAQISGDKQAIADILDKDFDAHLTTACAMWEKDYNELKSAYESGDKSAKTMRQDAKSRTFAPLYGASKGDKATERWYKEFKNRYSGLADTQLSWVMDVVSSEHKCLSLPWGMRYYWPYAKMNANGYCNVTTTVYNYPIQAFATAEIIPIALVYFWHMARERGLEDKVVIVNTVHDSAICEVDPEYYEEVEKLCIDIWPEVYRYLERVYNYSFDKVPLGTSVAMADNWDTGQEVGFNIYDNGKVEAQ